MHPDILLSTRNQDGDTALDIALREGFKDNACAILQAGIEKSQVSHEDLGNLFPQIIIHGWTDLITSRVVEDRPTALDLTYLLETIIRIRVIYGAWLERYEMRLKPALQRLYHRKEENGNQSALSKIASSTSEYQATLEESHKKVFAYKSSIWDLEISLSFGFTDEEYESLISKITTEEHNSTNGAEVEKYRLPLIEKFVQEIEKCEIALGM